MDTVDRLCIIAVMLGLSFAIGGVILLLSSSFTKTDNNYDENTCIGVKTDKLIIISKWDVCYTWVDKFIKDGYNVTEITTGFSGRNIYDPGQIVMRK